MCKYIYSVHISSSKVQKDREVLELSNGSRLAFIPTKNVSEQSNLLFETDL